MNSADKSFEPLIRTALVAMLAACVWATPAAAQSGEWSGTLRIDYSPTGAEGEMSIYVPVGIGGISSQCSSDGNDFTPCSMRISGGFTRPPPRTQTIVFSIYKDGGAILTTSIRGENYSRYDDLIALEFDVYAGVAETVWREFETGGSITFHFADANGLGQSISYAEHTFDIPPLPAIALQNWQQMRNASVRPMVWVRNVLGDCADEMMPGRGIIDVNYLGEGFEDVTCLPW